MEERILTNRQIQNYSDHPIREKKSNATYEKYLRDVRNFQAFVGDAAVTKKITIAWKLECLGLVI